jgi:hypothetical protein
MARAGEGEYPDDARFPLTRLERASLVLATLSHEGRGKEISVSSCDPS